MSIFWLEANLNPIPPERKPIGLRRRKKGYTTYIYTGIDLNPPIYRQDYKGAGERVTARYAAAESRLFRRRRKGETLRVENVADFCRQVESKLVHRRHRIKKKLKKVWLRSI